MKRAAFLNILLAFAWFTVGLPAVPPMAAPVTDAALEIVTELPSACATESASLPFQALMFPPGGGPRYCGDSCTMNGEEYGCIITSTNPWRKGFCYCQNGTLTC